MWKKVFFIAGFLPLGSASAGKKLPVKTIEVMDDGSVREILEQVGEGMRRSGGGQVVRKTVTKIPGKIPWGGVIAWGPALVNAALEYFFNEMKNAASAPLSNWMNGPKMENFGEPVVFSQDSTTYTPMGTPCYYINISGNLGTVWVAKGSNGRYITATRFNRPDGTVANAPSRFNSSTTDPETQVQRALDLCASNPVTTLADLIRNHPSVGTEVGNAMRDYIQARPDAGPVRNMYELPAPTANQWDDALIDPSIISVPGSRYSDGDYLQEGHQPTPGNRPHPLDGLPLEPWKDSITPVDTDNDGVPDWRDSDDDGDGFSDEEEDPDWQKDKEKTPVTEKDTDNDGVPDHTDQDDDGDGWSDEQEEEEGTDPRSPASTPTDTDRDGTPDSKDQDDDGDGWSDEKEREKGTDPKDSGSTPPDEDGDGIPDDEEEEEEEEEPKPCAEGEVAGEDGTCGPPEEEEEEGEDGPADQPSFESPELDKWDSSPVSEALEEAKRRIAEMQSKKLPFAVAEMFPKLGGVGSTCPQINVATGNRQMGNLQLEICESAPSQWMHTTGRSALEFVLTVMALLAAGRLVMNA